MASAGVRPDDRLAEPAAALSKTKTVAVGESIPEAMGGSVVLQATKMPPIPLPINIDQIAIGAPSLSWPGNIRAENDIMFAIKTTDARRPAVTLRKRSLALSAREDLLSTLRMEAKLPAIAIHPPR
jgi:hypothetical protein